MHRCLYRVCIKVLELLFGNFTKFCLSNRTCLLRRSFTRALVFPRSLEEEVGGRVRVKVVKNKVAAPFKVSEFDVLYNEGISPEGELIALGEKYGVVSKSGSSYSYGEVKLGRGYDAARTFLKENDKIKKEILTKIKTAAIEAEHASV